MNLTQSLDILGARKLHGRLEFQGLQISIENKKGSVRSGVARDGTKWSTTMTYPYGYIRKTEAADGDHVDCFIGPNDNAKKAFIIHIKHPDTGKYDEDKCFLGFDNAKAAKKAFDANYDRPERFYHGMTVMTMVQFKQAVLDKENHGEKLDMKSELGHFVSIMHIDPIPTIVNKTGKSLVPKVTAKDMLDSLKRQTYPQPFPVGGTAGMHPTGGTTPFGIVSVYSSRSKKGSRS